MTNRVSFHHVESALAAKKRLSVWIRIGAASAILLAVALTWGNWELAAGIAVSIAFLGVVALYTVEVSVNRKLWAAAATTNPVRQ